MTWTKGINRSAPNLVCLCVDETAGEQTRGRFYHRYSKEPIPFRELSEFLLLLEQLMEEKNFPQASMRTRSFLDKEKNVSRMEMEEEQVRSTDEILKEKGNQGTFIVHVQYRQNATWQGKVHWAETGQSCNFRSALELLKLIDGALDEGAKNGNGKQIEEQSEAEVKE